MKWKANFFDKHCDETRSLVVDACDEGKAETIAAARADKLGWPLCFKLGDVELMDRGN